MRACVSLRKEIECAHSGLRNTGNGVPAGAAGGLARNSVKTERRYAGSRRLPGRYECMCDSCMCPMRYRSIVAPWNGPVVCVPLVAGSSGRARANRQHRVLDTRSAAAERWYRPLTRELRDDWRPARLCVPVFGARAERLVGRPGCVSYVVRHCARSCRVQEAATWLILPVVICLS